MVRTGISYMKITYIIPPQMGEKRLSSVLTNQLKMSNSMLKRIKSESLVSVNGAVRYMNAMVLPGDEVQVTLPDEGVPDYPVQVGELNVLYEDELFIAVDKPAGILVHPSRSRFAGTLTNYVSGYLGGAAVHVVTRLDRDTRGVTLFAKNSYARALMGQTRMEKIYVGITCGVMEQSCGVIDLPIARVDPASMYRVVRDDGQPSITEYKVVKTVRFLGETANVVEFRLKTGRTHQIRVHCQAMGWPLLGDPMYYSPTSQIMSQEVGLDCQELTAKRLSFYHPISGELLNILSDFC